MLHPNYPGLAYMMCLHEGMYGIPMGPVYSVYGDINSRWDLYRMFGLTPFQLWMDNVMHRAAMSIIETSY